MIKESITCLLVEDSKVSTQVVTEMLKKAKHIKVNFLYAEDLASCKELLNKNKVNVILLDLNLPDSLGINTLKEVQSFTKIVPVIVLTSISDEEVGYRAIKLGAQEFFVKQNIDAPALERSILSSIERNKLRQAIIESNSRFYNIVENAEAGYFYFDFNGCYSHVNKAWLDMHGFLDSEEVIGKHITFFTPDEDKEERIELFNKVMNGETIRNHDLTKITKNGEIGYFVFSANPVYSKNNIVGVEGFLIDITDKKLAEEELKENRDHLKEIVEERTILLTAVNEKLEEEIKKHKEARIQITLQTNLLKAVINSIPALIFVKDLEGEYVGCNTQFVDFVGRSEAEIIGLTDYDLFDKDVADFFRSQDKLMFEAEGVRNNEEWVTYPDGTKVLLSTYKTRYFNNKNEVAGLVGISLDITQRKMAEEALRVSEERFRKVFYNSSDAITLTTLEEGRYIEVNKGFEQSSGYTSEEVLGKSVYELNIWVSNKQRLEIAEELKEKGSIENREFRFQIKDGTIKTGLISANIITLNNKPHLITIARDITDRKRMEETLKLTQAAIDHASDACFWILPNSRFFYVNKAASDMLGFTEEELVNMKVEDIKPYFNFDKWIKHWENVKRDKTFAKETHLLKKDGSLVPVEITSNYLQYGGVEHDCTFVRDITKRREAQEQLFEAMNKLEESNKQLEQFAFIASHDLQEPLRMISSYLQILEEDYNHKLGDDAKECIYFAVDGAKRLQQLIKDLLSFSRVTTKGKPFTKVIFNEVIKDVIDYLSITIEENNATVTYDKMPELIADENQIYQLFQNLIGNAIKFHGEQPPKVHVSAKYNNNVWTFSVKDNGIGIDEKNFEKIFVIFKSLHARDKFPGTGIGLAICKKIVERHQGEIWVESTPGKGTTFNFTIPELKEEIGE